MTLPTYRLVVRRLAALEIAEQSSYYRTKATESLAQRWRDAASNTIRSLRALPERGSLFDTSDKDTEGIRHLPIQGFPSHFLFYKIDTVSNTIVILRMLHGARDLKSML